MNAEHIKYAEKILSHIFIGSQLDGVKFGPGPAALLIRFEHYGNHSPDQLWLNIESKWGVYPKNTYDFPNSENEMSELSEEHEYKLIFELRREKVANIKLGKLAPHLHIEFESGKTLFVNGHHHKFECWQAGDGLGYSGDEWLVVATPGDGISMWAPQSF
ncbi:hypothetical protein DFP95_1285 [Cohnella lupini]|uniref:Uncharacterized protein n=1 Tax=Cohnella lupini TaxID=1294267 RepID=A0A3D9HU48_9BACL|nr:hypothetical protein [Cohnella lupini]RED52949.1 hypothetical protein DFP95_1285 [Cohnella lupini]